MYSKSNRALETIYEVDEEPMNSTDDRACQTTTTTSLPRTRLSCYVCWSMIGGCFFLITLFIVFSINPFFAVHSSSKSKLIGHFNDDVDLTTPSYNLFESSDRIVEFIEHFSEKINEELNLPPQTINIFTLRIANDQFWRENRLIGIYFHLDYPQFCWDNQQCRENFQVYLNDTMTQFSRKIAHLSSNSMEFVHCTSIENATSTTSVGFISTRTTDAALIDSVDQHFCEEVDHYYLLFAFFDPSQRHRNLFNTALNTYADECLNRSQNEEFDHPEENPISCPRQNSLPHLFLWNSY